MNSESMSADNMFHETKSGILHFGQARMALIDIEAGFWGLRRQIEALIGERLASSVLQQAGANGGASFAASFNAQDGADRAALFTACVQAYQSAGFGQFEIKSLQWPLGSIQIQATDAFEAWMYRRHGETPGAPICAYSAGVFAGFINMIDDRSDITCVEHTCQALGDQACLFELQPVSQAKGQTALPIQPDPGLGRQLNLLEMLFERMPMGIAVIDRRYRIQRYNPTWDDFSARYAPPDGAALAPGVGYFEHLPGTEKTIQPMFDRTLAGETIRQDNVRLETGGIITYWDVVMAPLHEKGEIVGILTVSIDVTERANLRLKLEERVSARTQELQMLLQVAATANSSLDLKETLTQTLDLLVGLVDADRAGVALIDEKTAKWGNVIVRPQREVDPADMAKMLAAGQKAIESSEMIVIPPDAKLGLLEPGALLPLQIRERKFGFLAIIGHQDSRFSTDQLKLFKSIANQLSIAIENAYLFQKAEELAVATERNRLARELHDSVTQTLFSASLIADVLPRIWERDIEQGQARLQELRELTRGALAEMRTLLLELRPATLTETSLSELLRQLTQVHAGRSRLPIHLTINGEQPLQPDIQVALYRIAQEAVNNIVKHAAAGQAQLTLTFNPYSVLLSIKDDGRGFDPAQIPSHTLGLGIMDERAQKIGANLTVQSQIGEGTTIIVHCPLAPETEVDYV